MDIKSNWNEQLDHERVFFSEWMKTKGLHWPEDFNFRMNPISPLQERLHDCLPVSSQVEILDVGAGPLTVLGKVYPGKTIDITAIDPMAEVYEDLLHENDIMPLVKTRFGVAEKVAEYFKENTFDIVHCQNALDHSYNPVRGIKQMLHVVKRGGWIVLHHETNEGENEKYANLHQWNFCEADGEFVIWNKAEHHNVNYHLKDQAAIFIITENGYNTVKIQKF